MPLDVHSMIATEYRDMPGLCLTLTQACRLWNLDAATCEAALMALVSAGALHRTARGHFTVLPIAARTLKAHLRDWPKAAAAS